MIIDKIENLSLYFSNDWVKQISSFYEKITDATKDGEYAIIENDKLFCKVLTYTTKQSNWITESHLEYVDFQIILEGEEVIEVYTPQQLEVKEEYNSKKDCVFYKYPLENTPFTKILLTKGSIGIFFPQDAHATQMSLDGGSHHIRKAVFKVHKSLF